MLKRIIRLWPFHNLRIDWLDNDGYYYFVLLPRSMGELATILSANFDLSAISGKWKWYGGEIIGYDPCDSASIWRYFYRDGEN